MVAPISIAFLTREAWQPGFGWDKPPRLSVGQLWFGLLFSQWDGNPAGIKLRGKRYPCLTDCIRIKDPSLIVCVSFNCQIHCPFRDSEEATLN